MDANKDTSKGKLSKGLNHQAIQDLVKERTGKRGPEM